MTENQRKFPRTEIEVEVELSFLEDRARTVITHDVSQGGLYMKIDDPDHYPLGEMVSLSYNDPLQNNKETHKDGIIVRCADDGIAVSFVEMEEF